MRVEPVVGTLRRRSMYKALREATITAALREHMRIVHVSLQRTHIHMLVEAADRTALSRGMQGFQISAARHINTALGRELARKGRSWNAPLDAGTDSVFGPARVARGRRGRAPRRCGRVFAERYYAEVITSPTQAHRAIRYVLLNWKKHGEDREGRARDWLVDPFSTGVLFPHWRELAGRPVMWAIREDYEPMFVYLPKTWLLAEGWKRVGTISVSEAPGSLRRARRGGVADCVRAASQESQAVGREVSQAMCV